MKTKTKKKGKKPKFKYKPSECLLIQWNREKPPVDKDGNLICPECGALAELATSFVGSPCFAHKICSKVIT